MFAFDPVSHLSAGLWSTGTRLARLAFSFTIGVGNQVGDENLIPSPVSFLMTVESWPLVLLLYLL